jgi:transcription antitermination protein NusB
MISRRNIRVKVMQTLYGIETMETALKPGEDKRILHKHIEQTRQLFVFLLYFIIEVARYAEKDALKRASKNLPSEEDMHVNTRLAGNDILWKILEDPSYKAAIAADKPGSVDIGNMIRKIYQQLAEMPEYLAYINQEKRDNKSEKAILELIFTDLMLPNDDFTQMVEDHYTNWDDDAEMMNLLMMNYLQKPGTYNLGEMVGPEKMQFAMQLLQTVQEKKEYTMELITPKLKNWDADRLAVLDMILIRMGVCELLYFDTIPTKVTINEYIDLAKEYSTPQSGQFVNGILDNIHKDQVSQDKIHKVNFKKS